MISIIVAFDKNNVIGKDNKLPWHYSEDLKYFKNTTKNKIVAMGYNTYLSIGKPLPNRKNIVFTRKNISLPNVEIFNDLDTFLDNYSQLDDEVFIIGGSSIYKQLLPYSDKLYITYIDKEYDGDTFFPDVDFSDWEAISEKKSGDLNFKIYKRK